MKAPPLFLALGLWVTTSACAGPRPPSDSVVALYPDPGDGRGQVAGRELAGRVKQALQGDPTLPKDRIAVVVKGDEVHLFGRLDAAEDRERAAALAEQVPGVRRVQNHILLPFRAREGA